MEMTEQDQAPETPETPESVDENTTPPPLAGELPPDPNIVGSLTQEEMRMLNMLRQQGNVLIMQVGDMEVRKARMLGRLQDFENEAQKLLNLVSKRLGIVEGTTWQVTPDGKARLVTNPSGPGFPPLRAVPPFPGAPKE
jgi:hypothetical protein